MTEAVSSLKVIWYQWFRPMRGV